MADSRRNIIWIASYPKSGNTWVRFMVCNLLFGGLQTAAALSRLSPDIHEVGDSLDTSAPALLVKTHFVYSSSLPFAERTSAAIYVARHPADVLASNFHYHRRRGGGADNSIAGFDEYFDTFIENRGDPRWVKLGMGSWDENVRGWLDPRKPFPVLCIKYEDLSANPRHICGMLAQVLRPSSSIDDVERAVANSSFERMREIEDADIHNKRVGIFYKPYLQSSIDSGIRFMRRGAVGDGSAELSAAQRARLCGAFQPLLAQLGYATD
jgi:hypothetical protein